MKKISPSSTYQLNPGLTPNEKLALVNTELDKLLDHFYNKAASAKAYFHLYKYTSILLAGITAIVSSLQVIYPTSFPQWILPIVSAAATVAVAFLGNSSTQRLWINSRTTGQQLLAEKFLFNQNAGRYNDGSAEEKLVKLSDRMIEIWNEGHGKWEQTVNEG